MVSDIPLACLTQDPRVVYDYLRQLCAQVTNPPIDSIRETIVMGLTCYVGPEGNILETKPDQYHRLQLLSPTLSITGLFALVIEKVESFTQVDPCIDVIEKVDSFTQVDPCIDEKNDKSNFDRDMFFFK